jgi:hypothetical protein
MSIRRLIFTTALLLTLAMFIAACATATPAAPTIAPSPTLDAMVKTPDAMAHETEVAAMMHATEAAAMAHATEAAAMALTPTPDTMAHPTDVMPHPTESAANPTEAAAMAHPAWKQLTSSSAPPARYDHTLVLDSDQQRLILFGGRADKTLGDTWVYDLKTNAWREVKSSGPPARFGHGAIYDPARKAMIIFGGQANGLFNDTWAFDTVNETWSEIKTADPKPDVRYGLGAAFDSTRERLIVSHGFAKDGRHDDTWALDLRTNTWTNITPSGDKPLKRCLLETAYDPSRDALILFGGCSSGFGPCPQGDLWTLDLKSDTWTQIKPNGDAPTARQNPALVFDSKENRAILFGGDGGGKLNDLWALDPIHKVWTKLALEGPSARKSHDAIYDAANNRVYLFGGATVNGASNELWELDL